MLFATWQRQNAISTSTTAHTWFEPFPLAALCRTWRAKWPSPLKPTGLRLPEFTYGNGVKRLVTTITKTQPYMASPVPVTNPPRQSGSISESTRQRGGPQVGRRPRGNRAGVFANRPARRSISSFCSDYIGHPLNSRPRPSAGVNCFCCRKRVITA